MESVCHQPFLGFVEVVKDLHFHVVAAEDHFAGFRNVVVAKPIIERHYLSFEHLADRTDDLGHLFHRDHLFEIVVKQDLTAAGPITFIDDLLPIRESYLAAHALAADCEMDKRVARLNVDGIGFVGVHAFYI